MCIRDRNNLNVGDNQLVVWANIVSKSNCNNFSLKYSDKDIVNSSRQNITTNSSVLSLADEGNTITMLNTSEYIEKTESLFRNDDYKILNTGPTNKLQKQIKLFVKNCSNIFPTRKVSS